MPQNQHHQSKWSFQSLPKSPSIFPCYGWSLAWCIWKLRTKGKTKKVLYLLLPLQLKLWLRNSELQLGFKQMRSPAEHSFIKCTCFKKKSLNKTLLSLTDWNMPAFNCGSVHRCLSMPSSKSTWLTNICSKHKKSKTRNICSNAWVRYIFYVVKINITSLCT